LEQLNVDKPETSNPKYGKWVRNSKSASEKAEQLRIVAQKECGK